MVLNCPSCAFFFRAQLVFIVAFIVRTAEFKWVYLLLRPRHAPVHGGSERSTCSAVTRAWREQARACFESPSSTAPCAGGCHTRLHRPLHPHHAPARVRQRWRAQRRRAHVRWFSAINPSANKTTQKARGRPRRGRQWAARPRQTRALVCFSRRAVRGAGAALPRCPGPRSADLKRAPSNFSKSGRDGRRGAAAQHTHYGGKSFVEWAL